MAAIWKADGSEVTVEPSNGKTFSLEEMQSFVDGYIEIISVEENKIMVINEEGLLMGLPNNMGASVLAKTPIVGNVLVCKPEEVE